MKKDKNNASKKIGALIVAIAVLLVSVTGATFAYFALTVSNNATITGTTATAGLTLSVQEQTLGGTSSGSPVTGKMVPQLYSALGTAISSSYNCVDANGNTVCKVYKITVANQSSASVVVNGTIQFTEFNGSGTTNLRWRRIDGAQSLGSTTTGAFNQYGVQVVVNSAETSARFDLSKGNTETDSATNEYVSGVVCVPSNSSYNDANHCTDLTLGPVTNGTTTSPYNEQEMYIVVWLRETGTDQSSPDAGHTFLATVTFEGDNGQGITSTIVS